MEFKYKGLNNKRKLVRGVMICKSELEVIEYLKANDILCISCESRSENRLPLIKKISFKELEILCRTLKNNLKSGIPIIDSLKLANKAMNKLNISFIIKEVIRYIELGNTLTEAFEKYKNVFPYIFIAMINIGEQSGSLEEVFQNLEDYFYQAEIRRKRIINVTTYPIIIFIISIIVALIIIVKFLPKFFSNMQIDMEKMPFVTRLYLSISNSLKEYKLFLLPLFIVITLLFKLIYKRIIKSESFEKFKYESIIFKKIYILSFQCNFTRALYMIIKSGIDIKKAFYIMKSSEPSEFLRRKYLNAIENLDKGVVLSKVIKDFNLFSNEFILSLMIGEENGSLEETLIMYNKIFEEDLKHSIDLGIKFTEVILIIMAGLFILSIYIAIMIPLYSIYNL